MHASSCVLADTQASVQAMTKTTEPRLPSIHLRIDRFEQRCAERETGETTAARAKLIGISRPDLSRIIRKRLLPGTAFIAATLLTFEDENTSLGHVFEDLFEVVPGTARSKAAA